MGIDEVLTAPHAPWQNAFVERFVGSARRECFDHVIVFNEAGLRKLMLRYCSYYERSPTHLRWTRTRRFLVRLCRPVMATSWRSPRPGASTIGTNGARPERPSHRPLVRHERPALTPTHGPAAVATHQPSDVQSGRDRPPPPSSRRLLSNDQGSRARRRWRLLRARPSDGAPGVQITGQSALISTQFDFLAGTATPMRRSAGRSAPGSAPAGEHAAGRSVAAWARLTAAFG